jgi:anti-anti-sigma factor
MDIKIIATTGRAQGSAVDIHAAKFFIGRHGNCQIRPDIPGLAGIHALIEQRDNHVFLRDFGAEGGTGINDRVLHARETEVFDSDLIQIGPMVLTLWMKPKGQDSPESLHDAPDGWPYFSGVLDDEAAPGLVRVDSVFSEPHRPKPIAPEPIRSEPSHAPRPTPRPAPVPVSVAVSNVAAVVEKAPVPAPSPAPTRSPMPARPIVGRQHGRRAIACETIDDVMVVTILPSDLNEEESVSPVRYELRSLLEEEKTPSKMVIDMGNTRYLSSRAVGVLLAHYQGLERKGATMRVCGVSKEIKPVLDQMRLSMLIDIYPTVEEAVKTDWD